LLGPTWDLLFLANLTWPLIVGVAVWSALSSGWQTSNVVQSMLFWQIYFISTPHRWITLALVFLDEEKFQERPVAFMTIGVVAVLFVTGVALATGQTLLLVVIDFFWNAWHFAAQHSGISRIYQRSARPGEWSRGWLDKFLLRSFVLFVMLRVATLACLGNCGRNGAAAAGEIIQNLAGALPGVSRASLETAATTFTTISENGLDFVFLAFALVLILREVSRFRPASLGGLVYLGSVVALYSTFLYGLRTGNMVFLLAMALAHALFHATEYLGIVSFAVIRKHSRSTSGIFRHLVPRWAICLAAFILFLGISAWMIESHRQNEWAVVTIAISYLHYAYDGMIWKAPRKKAV
jgi:hypothetical protein